ncbi:protein ANTAGONIST OF LIKE HETEROCHROMATIN PROTEIN 1-like [Camponotus floridanus]|uniref:protein ANTAGONIST OF LIKE HETEROCHROMATIN PROTEIN 1-like n=1 Tax=Camponotus floridanus TaxID=104421 RepID=UPI000DC6B9CC|nr:protein ANTAGONIST OF LIKE HETEROCHROMATIN PROTEIN 1-like [Camponotus floridanus]
MEVNRQRLIVAAVVLGDNLLRSIVIFDSDSDSSDSDTDEDDLQLWRKMILRGRSHKPLRLEGYVERIIPLLTKDQFRKHFRMIPNVFENLEALLDPVLSVTNGKAVILVRKQLLATLWLLATPDSYRSVGERFDIAKSSLSYSFMRVIEAINDIAGQFIKWPRGQYLQEVKTGFSKNIALCGIIGAIDGTHILIKQSRRDAQFYKTYKKTYAITLQAVCDDCLRFTDCFAGYPGSVGDLRILRNSDLWREIQIDKQNYFPEDEFIIGDKAYPVSWCIPPYIDRGQLINAQKKFNHEISAKRSVIERAFALLKGRFRRLKYLDMNVDEMIPYVIIACTVLHNICLKGVDDNVEDLIEEGAEVIDEDIYDVGIANEVAGEIKRDYLCNLVAGV